MMRKHNLDKELASDIALKDKNGIAELLISAIYAGAFIAIACIVSYICSFSPLLSAIVFPLGIMLVVLLKVDLFTGCCGTYYFPLLESDTIGIKTFFKMLAVVYIGNFIGILIISLISYFYIPSEPVFNKIDKWNSYDFNVAFIVLQGILCNLLVCGGVFVWKILTNRFLKTFLMWSMVSLFVYCGFEHSVADMYVFCCHIFMSETFEIIETHSMTMLWITAGNFIGGIIVALIVKYLLK